MSEQDNGGPAFPQSVSADGLVRFDPDWCGMSLRDWFAGLAMQGACANAEFAAEVRSWAEAKGRNGQRHVAEHVYELADAMLAERSKSHE